jgi:hypothetical protein
LERPGCAEVCELADVVDLNFALVLADLAGVREETFDDLLVRIVDPDRLAVDDRCRSLPVKWNGAVALWNRQTC